MLGLSRRVGMAKSQLPSQLSIGRHALTMQREDQPDKVHDDCNNTDDDTDRDTKTTRTQKARSLPTFIGP